MDQTVKNYNPITIPDTPLPGLTTPAIIDNTSSDPITTADTPLPQVNVSQQTISDSLNTLSKRILKEYQFAQAGALAIGTYVNGVSGDLRLTPDGLTARNSSGVTTFAIDGTTGNATFAGEIIGGTISIGSNFSVDASGNLTCANISVTSGTISGATITGSTIIGGTIETSSGNPKVVLSSSANAVQIYNGSGTEVVELSGALGIGLFNANFIYWANNNGLGTIYGVIGQDGSNNFQIQSGAGNSVRITPANGTVTVNGRIDLTNNNLDDVNALMLISRGSGTNPPSNYMLDAEDAGTQQVKWKFANNGSIWALALNNVCTPVKPQDHDPLYFEKYDLMTDLDDSRFKLRQNTDKDTPPAYRGQPVLHYPSMGMEGTEFKEHEIAQWKRPWLPMKQLPVRMETMGQYPYPPVHSKMIGYGEPSMNLYLMIAFAYNQLQERCDKLEIEIQALKGK